MRQVLALTLALLAWAAPETNAAELHVVSQIEGDNASARGMEIVKEAYRRAGLEVKAEILPNERGIVSANNGDTDGDTMRVAGLEAKYPNLVRVPEPVMLFNVVAFTAGLNFDVKGWESLKPHSLCIVRGFKLGEIRTEGMNRELPANPEAALRMVRAGHCAVATMAESFWLMIDEMKLGPLRALDKPVESVPLYHYVHARHAGLVPKLADALKSMHKDGSIDRIMATDRAAIQAAKERNSVRE